MGKKSVSTMLIQENHMQQAAWAAGATCPIPGKQTPNPSHEAIPQEHSIGCGLTP